jgi:hypothetical protein
MRGPVRARWYDPVSGAFFHAFEVPHPGTPFGHLTNASGWDDWVPLLEGSGRGPTIGERTEARAAGG